MKKKKESRWRREQKQRKKKLSLRAIKWALVFILLIFLGGIAWQMTRFFKDSVWDGRSRLNLVLYAEPISLASLDTSSQTISFLVIPDGTYIEAAGGYGPCRVEKIYPLGELEDRGIELLAASFETYFGLPVDGWLRVEEEWRLDETKRLFSGSISLVFKDQSRTNLSYWDLTRLWLMVNRTRGHKIETVNLGETTVAEEFTLPDGTKARKVDSQRIGRIMSNLFTDERLRQEDLAIAVMNASGETGLAADAARLVTNIGGRLVEVGDWPEKLEDCQIKTTAATKKSYTSQKLANIFNCQFGADLEGGERWDLLVVLGGSDW